MFDSRTDHPRGGVHAGRANYKRENLFASYNVFGPTYRALHQAPAPDLSADETLVPAQPTRVLRPGKTARDKARSADVLNAECVCDELNLAFYMCPPCFARFTVLGACERECCTE